MRWDEFSPEELEQLRLFDAEIDDDPCWDPVEVELARKRDQRFADEKLEPRQLAKRLHDRDYYQRNKDKRNAANAEYRKSHAEEMRQYGRDYYAKNRADMLERRQAYAKANHDAIAVYQKLYYADHAEKMREYRKDYYQSHREESLARSKEWHNNNREKAREYNRNWWNSRKDIRNAQRREQSNASRRMIWLTHNGKTQTITQWANELGIKRKTLASRIERGWDIERALTQQKGGTA
jgi:hypothetical protein